MTSICSGHVKSFRDDSQRLVNRRQVSSLKLDVEHGADDLHDFADVVAVGGHVSIRRSHTVFELLFRPIKANKTGRIKSQTR